jgi:hypothetical protein
MRKTFGVRVRRRRIVEEEALVFLRADSQEQADETAIEWRSID